MDTGFKRTDKRLKSLENRIIKKLNIIAEFFDKPILEYEKRIKRVEDHLGFPQLWELGDFDAHRALLR